MSSSDHTQQSTTGAMGDVYDSADIVTPTCKFTVNAFPRYLSISATEEITLFQVVVRLIGPSIQGNISPPSRSPIDLVMVIEASESMHGKKLFYVKNAIRFVIQNMAPTDRLSIVSFSFCATRVFPLSSMTERGQEEALRAVDAVVAAESWINVVEGLTEGVHVLEERMFKNPFACILFLSGGRDNCYSDVPPSMPENCYCDAPPPGYLELLPASIYPGNQETEKGDRQCMFPVFSFGLGSGHDPVAMHAISDASGGTYSFVELYESTQNAVAGCMGGLLSVVALDIHLNVVAFHGVKIQTVSGWRYVGDTDEVELIVGSLYANEEKEFLFTLSIPQALSPGVVPLWMPLLCNMLWSYRDPSSPGRIDRYTCNIPVPDYFDDSSTPASLMVFWLITRFINIRTIEKAHSIEEIRGVDGAREYLMTMIVEVLASHYGQDGDSLCVWSLAEMLECARRMGTQELYHREGRAYVLSVMSSHAAQRGTTRGKKVAGDVCPTAMFNGQFDTYVTPNMVNMVKRSKKMSMFFKIIFS